MNIGSLEVWLPIAAIAGATFGFLFYKIFSSVTSRRVSEIQRAIEERIKYSRGSSEFIASTVERILKSPFRREDFVANILVENDFGNIVSVTMKTRYLVRNVSEYSKDYDININLNNSEKNGSTISEIIYISIDKKRIDFGGLVSEVYVDYDAKSQKIFRSSISILPNDCVLVEIVTKHVRGDRDHFLWSSAIPTERALVSVGWDKGINVSMMSIGPGDIAPESESSLDRNITFIMEGLLPGQGFLLSWDVSNVSVR